MNFADRLRTLFKNRETQNEFAERIGISFSGLKKWLSGDASDPRMTNLVAISAATGVSIHWLVTGEGPKMAADLGSSPAGGTGERMIPESEVVAYLEERLEHQRTITRFMEETIRDFTEIKDELQKMDRERGKKEK